MKINQLSKNALSKQEMKHTKGGACGCGCGCYYENKGGSSTSSNNSANNAGGLHSPGMIAITGHMNEDGTWTLYECPIWVKVV